MLARNVTIALALCASAAAHAAVIAAMPHPLAVAGEGAALDLDLDVTPAPEPAPPIADDEPAAPPAVAPRATKAVTGASTKATHDVAKTAPPAGDPVAPVVASDAAPLRFVMAMPGAPGATGTGTTTAPTAGTGAAGDPVYDESGVDARPRLLTWRAPDYPASAASAGVEVDVPVDVLVDTEGNVIDARLPKHFGYGLDEAAATAAHSYHFSRGLKAGRPVRVRMRCTVVFRLN
jgi:TonB family protein